MTNLNNVVLEGRLTHDPNTSRSKTYIDIQTIAVEGVMTE